MSLLHRSVEGPPRARLGVSDQPITGADYDTLSLSNEARALARFIANCVTPLTIAIQGDWGSGKTSLLRIIEEQLGPSGDVRCREAGARVEVIRFETWQYAQFGGGPSLPISLLSMLARRLAPPGMMSKAKNVLRSLALPTANAVLKMASHDLIEIGEADQSGMDFAESCDNLRRDLSEIIASKRKDGVERVVVLIDDLDRVDPGLAVDILQTIKMFLDLESCVFVLALDFAVVKEGVKKRFDITDDHKARAFFDKIIQLPFQMPIAKYDVGRFVGNLLAHLDGGEREGAARTLIALARPSISFNPRAIKRVMNSLHLTLLVNEDRFKAIRARDAALSTLFGLLCLQARYPEAYAWLMAQADLSQALAELGQTENGASGDLMEKVGLSDPLDRKDFPAFARELAVIAAELVTSSSEDLTHILGMTRTTSVGQQGSTYQLTGDMRDENKAMMQRVLEHCRSECPEAAIEIKARRDGSVELTTDEESGVRLSLEHALSWLGLSVYASDQAKRVELANHLGAKIVSDGSIHVWKQQVSEYTDMATRGYLLADAPKEFAKAWRALRETAGAA